MASYSEVVLGSQYWGQYYLAISSTIWMMGCSTLIRLADDTRLILWRAQLLFRRTSITWRKGLIETSKLNRDKCQALHLECNNPMQWYGLGSSSAERSWGPGEPPNCESVVCACGDDGSWHAGWCTASRWRGCWGHGRVTSGMLCATLPAEDRLN